MKNLLLAPVALALASCSTMNVPPPALDELARQYLAVQLAIGEKDPGYVDAYYGPEELATAAAAQDTENTLPILQARVLALDTTLRSLRVAPGSVEAERVRYLRAMLNSASRQFMLRCRSPASSILAPPSRMPARRGAISLRRSSSRRR